MVSFPSLLSLLLFSSSDFDLPFGLSVLVNSFVLFLNRRDMSAIFH